MSYIGIDDIDYYEIGNTIQQWGCVYSDGKRIYILPFPDEDHEDVTSLPMEVLKMSPEEWERWLTQSDVLDTKGPEKAILRKSQRQIDAFMQWRVYERDDYRCRYCHQRKPLTVDHIDLWEDGGATTDENLVASCKGCNKKRGRTKYHEWILSEDYRKLSKGLPEEVKRKNYELVKDIPKLVFLRVRKIRSR